MWASELGSAWSALPARSFGVKLPKINLVDDKAAKPVGIHRFIGRRPIAFGNSDGDYQMLQWTAAGDGARFMGIVRHTDGEREWAYDRQSSIGRLDKARRSDAKGLDRRGHEAGLEGHLPVPEVRRAGGRRYAPDLALRAESSATVSRVA